ncbi:MAG: TonB-dependent receptor [Flavobacteriales bacterium]|nr:TonB-dependent receptor [Flavobacteriales bacterium]
MQGDRRSRTRTGAQDVSFLRTVLLILLVPIHSQIDAQLLIRVVEAGRNTPLAGAHVLIQPLEGEQGQVLVAGADGMVAVSLPEPVITGGLVVRASCVGLIPLQDTIRQPVEHTLALTRSVVALDELVVTGQYAPGSAQQAVQRVHVLDAQQIEHMAANHLGDVLRNELNMRLAQENVLGASVSMQGLGGENVKVLIDGVPVIGRSDGKIDLSQIDLTAIERVEVIQGPMSVNYGSNALAGTINLITRRSGGQGDRLKALVYAEHIGRLNTTVTASRGWARGDLVLSGGRNAFMGWDPAQPGWFDASPNVADSSRYQQWKPREQYFGRINLRHAVQGWTLGYKGEVMDDRLIARGRPRSPYYETALDEVFRTLRLDNGLFAERRWSHGIGFQGHLAYGLFDRVRTTTFKDLTTLEEVPVSTQGASDTTRFSLLNARATLNNAGPQRVLGWEGGMEVNHEEGRGERMGPATQAITDAALFGSLEYRPVERLVIRPGMRVAYNSSFSAPLVPALNVRWSVAGQHTLRFSYAQGFRAPSLKELHLYFVDVNHDITGNPDLVPERSHNLTASWQWRQAEARGIWRIDLDGFLNEIRDQINLAEVAGLSYTYVNIGQVRTAGGALNGGWRDQRWDLSAGGGVTGWQDGDMQDAGTSMTWMPEVRASATVQLPARLTFAAFYKYTGDLVRYAVNAEGLLTRGTIASFHLLDANIARRIWMERLDVAVGCKDILNTGDLATTMSGGAHTGGAGQMPMTTGRTWFLRLQLDLVKRS